MRSALLPLALAHCAAPAFATTSLGVTHMHVAAAPAPLATLQAEEEIVARHLVRDYGWDARAVRSALEAAEVRWGAGEWATEGRVIHAGPSGTPCQALAAYRHELLHLVGAYLGQPDRWHRGAWWTLARPEIACPAEAGGP